MTIKIDFTNNTIRFDDKPSAEVIQALKYNRYRWNPRDKYWYGGKPSNGFFQWLDKQMNPDRPDGECWHCGAPNGKFRNRGAATPVLCDGCAGIK